MENISVSKEALGLFARAVETHARAWEDAGDVPGLGQRLPVGGSPAYEGPVLAEAYRRASGRAQDLLDAVRDALDHAATVSRSTLATYAIADVANAQLNQTIADAIANGGVGVGAGYEGVMTYNWYQHTGTPGMQVMQEWLGQHDEQHIAQMADGWRDLQRDLSRETHDLHRQLRELRHRWTGPAADAFFAQCYKIQQDAREFLEAAPEFEDRLSDVAVSITTAKRDMPPDDKQNWYNPGDWFDGNPWEPMADTLTRLSQAEEAAAEAMPWVGRASAWALGMADDQFTQFPDITGADYGSGDGGAPPFGPEEGPGGGVGPSGLPGEDLPGGGGAGGGGAGDQGAGDQGYGGQGYGGQGAGGNGAGGNGAGGTGAGGTGSGGTGSGGTGAGSTGSEGGTHYPGRPDVPGGLPGDGHGDGGSGGDAGYPGRPDVLGDPPGGGHGGSGGDAGYPGRPELPGGGAGGHGAPGWPGGGTSGGGTSGGAPAGGWPGGSVDTVAGGFGGGMPGGVGVLAAGAGALGIGLLGGKALGGALKTGGSPAAGLALPPGGSSGTAGAGSAAAVGRVAAASAGSSGGVAPMMPMAGMGGGMGGGDGTRSRRSSWLREDAEVWGGSDAAPGVVNNDTVT